MLCFIMVGAGLFLQIEAHSINPNVNMNPNIKFYFYRLKSERLFIGKINARICV